MQHPAARLLVWGAAAVAVQLLQGPVLYLFTAFSLALGAACGSRRLLRLVRRSRWLLVAVAVLFSFSTPGVLLLPDLGMFSPTTDGLGLAAIHLLRLLSVLATLAWLMERTPRDALVGGIYEMLGPASRVGLDPGRVAVRLMLVMQYAESARGGAWRDWLEPAAIEGPQRILLTRTPWRSGDILALVAAFAALGGLLAA